MPWTASSPLQSRATAKARPSAATRAANLVSNTPVLFRLPAIQHLPPRVEIPAIVAAEIGAAVAQPEPIVAVQAQPETAVHSQTGVAAPVAATIPSPPRSWWEHWSSGVVLIVLLIALATVSVLAIRGNNAGEPKYIADVDKTQSVSSNTFDTLSNIEVPGIAPLNQSPPTTSGSSSTELAGNLTMAEAIPATTNHAATSTTANSVNANQNSLLPTESLVLTLDSQSKVAKSSRTFLGVDISKFSTSNLAAPELNHSPAAFATASLDAPIGLQPPRLFNEDSTAPRGNSVSATPASTKTNDSSPGASPSFYDSSSTIVAKPNSYELGSNLIGESDLISTPNSYPAIPAMTVSNDLANPQPTLLVGKQEMAADQAATKTAAVTQVRSTSTPEFNREQLLRAYQEFTRAAVPGQNRYQPATNGSNSTIPANTASSSGNTPQPTYR